MISSFPTISRGQFCKNENGCHKYTTNRRVKQTYSFGASRETNTRMNCLIMLNLNFYTSFTHHAYREHSKASQTGIKYRRKQEQKATEFL